MMKALKPFNLQAALNGAPVVTRDGRKVLEIHHFTECFGTDHPVRAVVEGIEGIDSFTVCGRYVDRMHDRDYDLFMAPVKKTFYVNFYQSTNASYHATELSARECASVGCWAIAVPVELEV
jgi:hypothetical protein